jgi:hypothetical protein
MKTPCQKLGYKVGDKFQVLHNHVCGFKEGATVTLFEDDGSKNPLFSGECAYNIADGGPGACMHLDFVEPLKPKKAKRPWIKWEGGECPVPEGTLIDVKRRDGEKYKKVSALGAYNYHWNHVGYCGDIVAYRLAKPKKAAEPAQEPHPEPTVQREANGRPVGAKEGDWFRVIKSWYFEPGTITTLQRDNGTGCPFFTDTGDAYPQGVAEPWVDMEPCPAPSQSEPEPAKPEWEILWGSAEDFEGAPDWAVYVSPAGSFLEDVIKGARLAYGGGVEDTVKGVANCRPKAARRLKQPK